MTGKYDDLARAIVDNVGGKENIRSVAHCITRVRFKLGDEKRANTKAIRYDLGQRIRLQVRKIPELVFFIDDSLDYIENIDNLLRK